MDTTRLQDRIDEFLKALSQLRKAVQRDTFHRLAASPLMGKACDEVMPGYRKFPQGSHVIFHKKEAAASLRLCVFFTKTWMLGCSFMALKARVQPTILLLNNRHARRQGAEQFVADAAGGAGDFVHRQAFAPEHDRAAYACIWQAG